MREILRAKRAGFCYGVERAVRLALETAMSGVPCVTLGDIIHNTSVKDKLKSLGVSAITRPEDAPPGVTVIVRSHGVTPEALEVLRRQGNPIVDATCPDVSRIHKLLEQRKDKLCVILGDKEHPEVIAHAARCERAVVIASAEEFAFPPSEEVVILAQTTAQKESWENCCRFAKKCCTNLEILDTICKATHLRQEEAMGLAQSCEAVVVVGDRQSSNANHLAESCRRFCRHVFLVENADELPELAQYARVGLTAGASTPDWRIEEVYGKMSDEIMKTETMEESFAELLEQSLKSLNTGDKVVGVVTNITPTEIYVDLGTKHAGYIPVAELSDDPEYKVEEHIKVGEDVEVYVLRVNDVEGTAMLSKRRLDTVKSWEDVENAQDSNVLMEGIVTEENKGGVVVSVKGVRVFVPASQTGLPKDAPMSELLKRRVKLRITEFNRARRRVVGSIRLAQQEERRAKSESVWTDIAVGKRYNGTVKSLTSYGAFVDIGGVDGMVHVSELSWSRVRQPGDLVKVGDPLEVYVISFDAEKRKISLGHKNKNENPWVKFTEKHRKDDVCKARVASLMPFGAFAEIMPGVDGLIHISQITDRRIGKPGDVLSVGQEVDVMITDIDYENQKISLSIRALMEQVTPQQEAGADTPDEVVATSEAGNTQIGGGYEEEAN